METQEFDEELQETNRIYKEIGDLNTKELLELQGAITQIKEKSQKEKKENTLSWLELSVISVLKDYAEEISVPVHSECKLHTLIRKFSKRKLYISDCISVSASPSQVLCR